jgi:ribosomal protein S27E
MKINCISCGYTLTLDDDVYSDYENQVKCFICKSMLEIKTEEGKLRSIRQVKQIRPEPDQQSIPLL